MSSPFMDYLNVQGILNLAVFLGPIITLLVKDILKFFVKPLGQTIFSTSADPADKKINMPELIESFIRNAILIAILSLVWIILYKLVKIMKY